MKKNLFIAVIFISAIILIASCTKKVGYDPLYEYVDKKITYEDTTYIKQPPIIKRDNFVIAFTRFAGANEPEVEKIAESIKLGFIYESNNSKNVIKNIRYISRSELLRKLTREDLNNMGPNVEKVLKNAFGVNVICTGTVLSSSKLSIEVLDLKTGKLYTDVFKGGDWEYIGEKVARAFFGTREKRIIETKTKIEKEKKFVKYQTYKEEYDDSWNGCLPYIIIYGGIGIIALIISLSS